MGTLSDAERAVREAQAKKAQDRAHSWHLAVLAFAGALLAAVIGLGSAFIAASHEDEQSQEEFLRMQRQLLYADFLSGAQKAKSALDPFLSYYYDAAESGDPPEGPLPTYDQAAAIDTLLRDLDAVAAQIVLLQDEKSGVQGAARRVKTILDLGALRLYDDYCESNPGSTLEPCVFRPNEPIRDIYGTYSLDSFGSVDNYIEEFGAAAREELDSNTG